MTLMRLAPECVRLRRMARAHAAGEISAAEYRAARREVIDNFPAGAVAEDDTRPRVCDDPTLRADSRVAGPPGVEVPESAPTISDRRWLWLAGGVLVLAAAVLTLPEAFAADAAPERVPPVSERTADPMSSPRVGIRAVKVTWRDAAEDVDVDLAELQSEAERSLASVRERSAPGLHGFTPGELEEVARFLDVLGVHRGEGGLDAADAQDLSALIGDQKRRRGISVAELEEVAVAVQERLRAAGYFLGTAYLPAQEVHDGVVRIEVLPGRLGDIVVEGGDPGPVTGTFAPLLGQAVTLSAVSRRLQALNSLPGFTAQASFGPGAEVGTSRLRLDLLEQRRWQAAIGIDNHGDEATGEHRVSLDGAWLNPRGAGDRLGAGLLASASPSNQSYGYLEYHMPLAADYRLSARIGNNDFTSDAVAELDGGGTFLDVTARRHLLHERGRGLTLAFGAGRHVLDYDDGLKQKVILANVGAAGHRVWDGLRIAADGALNLQLGHIGGDRFEGQDDGFWALELDSEAWMPLPLPAVEQPGKLRAYLAGQWSDSLLPATRRFALGGAARARAFERSAFLADRGLLLGLEGRAPLPLGELLVFTETAYGDSLTGGDQAWARLTNAGLGWHAELAPGLMSRLSWAIPVTTDGSGGFDDDGSRWFWSLRYEH